MMDIYDEIERIATETQNDLYIDEVNDIINEMSPTKPKRRKYHPCKNGFKRDRHGQVIYKPGSTSKSKNPSPVVTSSAAASPSTLIDYEEVTPLEESDIQQDGMYYLIN